MSSTTPCAGRYCPISSRKRWRMIVKRAQQYARTTGSSYARMTLRIVSLRIDPVAVPLTRHGVAGREPVRERGEAVDPLVAARGPAGFPQDHERRRARAQITHELGSQPLDHRRVGVMVEMKVVHEPCRLDEPRP